MKTAIVFADGLKQIIFTPENDDEKRALNLITPDDNIELAVVSGSFGEERFKPFRANVEKSQGGYLRVYGNSISTMLILTPKEKI